MISQSYSILEAIETFVSYKHDLINFQNTIGGTYPKIRTELNHKIAIYDKCIERLWARYYQSKGNNG